MDQPEAASLRESLWSKTCECTDCDGVPLRGGLCGWEWGGAGSYGRTLHSRDQSAPRADTCGVLFCGPRSWGGRRPGEASVQVVLVCSSAAWGAERGADPEKSCVKRAGLKRPYLMGGRHCMGRVPLSRRENNDARLPRRSPVIPPGRAGEGGGGPGRGGRGGYGARPERRGGIPLSELDPTTTESSREGHWVPPSRGSQGTRAGVRRVGVRQGSAD